MSYLKDLAFQVVTKHINAWDPEHLLDLGAPDDEYEYEIDKVVELVLDSKDEIEIAESIQDTFNASFGEVYDFDRVIEVAKKIWKEPYE